MLSGEDESIRSITSLQNPHIKAARALHRSAGRKEAGCLLVEGFRLLEEALLAQLSFEQIFFLPDVWRDQRGALLLRQAQMQRAAMFSVNENVLNALSQTEQSQGIVARVAKPLLQHPFVLAAGMRLIVADRLQDPGNLGTILRLASAFACDALLLLEGSVDPWNDKVVRASMGAVFHLPTVLFSEQRLIQVLEEQGIPLLIAAATGERLVWEMDLRGSWALVIGNEGAGVSVGLHQAAQYNFRIPMPGKAESLNAATAAAIVLYEASRQVTISSG